MISPDLGGYIPVNHHYPAVRVTWWHFFYQAVRMRPARAEVALGEDVERPGVELWSSWAFGKWTYPTKKGNWSNPTVVLHPQIRDFSKQKLGSSTNKHGQLDRGKWGVRANFCKESCGDWTSKAWDLMAVDILIYGYTYITRARWDWSRTRESNNQIPEIRDTSWIYSQNQHKQSNLLKTGFAWFWRHYSLRCNPWKPTHTLRLNILWS